MLCYGLTSYHNTLLSVLIGCSEHPTSTIFQRISHVGGFALCSTRPQAKARCGIWSEKAELLRIARDQNWAIDQLVLIFQVNQRIRSTLVVEWRTACALEPHFFIKANRLAILFIDVGRHFWMKRKAVAH